MIGLKFHAKIQLAYYWKKLQIILYTRPGLMLLVGFRKNRSSGSTTTENQKLAAPRQGAFLRAGFLRRLVESIFIIFDEIFIQTLRRTIRI